MNDKTNKYIEVVYKLYADTESEPELIEEATIDAPYKFISGLGIALKAFEDVVASKVNNETFNFTLTPNEAYGNREAERVLDLSKDVFSINGHFDHDNVCKDAILPLENEDGNRFMGKVLDVGEDSVKIDLNHPLAGKTLTFKGVVTENREATNTEIQGFINSISGGCGCGCGGEGCNCGSSCNCGDDHKHGKSGCGCGCC